LPEHGVGIAVVRCEAMLDLELSRQATAEVFIAAEAEARGVRLLQEPGLAVVGHARVAGRTAVVACRTAVATGDRLVQRTIDRDRRLGRCGTSKRAQNCESEQRFFHCDYLLG